MSPALSMPEGYKMTEVGVIPGDWDVFPLRKISPSQSVGLVINPSTYVEDHGVIPMLVGSNIYPNKINWDNARRISVTSNQSLPASQLFAGDLVVVRVGEPGITAVVPPELDGCNCASVMIVRQHSRFSSRWLCYVMNSKAGLSQIANVQYGTAQKQFNISDAINFKYATPPKAEQQAIAEALSDADALVESLEQLLTKKRQIKQGTMQELLTGQKRLPGFVGEWEETLLGSVLTTIVGGGTPSRMNPNFWGGPIPWVTVKDFATFSPKTAQESITETGLKGSASHLIPAGILITSTRMALGKAVIYEVDVAINQDLKALFPKPCLDTVFLYYWFEENAAKIDELGSGSTVKGISLPDLKKIDFLLPEIEEQTAIATILSNLDSDLAALQAQLVKARQIKQGMMQELLTGRIRLVSPAITQGVPA